MMLRGDDLILKNRMLMSLHTQAPFRTPLRTNKKRADKGFGSLNKTSQYLLERKRKMDSGLKQEKSVYTESDQMQVSYREPFESDFKVECFIN